MTRDWLEAHKRQITMRKQARWVRINAVETGMWREDLAAVMAGAPEGIMLPKAEGPEQIRQVAAERGLKLGEIVDAFDARIQGIVSNWAEGVDGARAVALGLPQPPPLKTIVEQYLADFVRSA